MIGVGTVRDAVGVRVPVLVKPQGERCTRLPGGQLLVMMRVAVVMAAMAGKPWAHALVYALDRFAQLGLARCTRGRRHHMGVVGACAVDAVERDDVLMRR
jgi:hypothetical protein